MASEGNHFQRVDVLRGIAIFLVFIHHVAIAAKTLNPSLDVAAQRWNWRWMFVGHEFGTLGVKLFFVISGFCIHNSYLSWKKRNPAAPLSPFWLSFFHRRCWRILPPYLGALILFYLLQYSDPFAGHSLKHFIVHATLVNTFWKGFFFNINPSFWSIAVEWQLYLIYPLLLLIALRVGVPKAFLIATAISAFSCYLLPLLTPNFALQQLPTKWWLDWSIGVLVADAFAERRQIFRYHAALSLVGMTVTLALLYTSLNPVLLWVLAPLTCAIILEGVLWSKRRLGRLEGMVASLGICSFSFYLFHQPIVTAALARLDPQTSRVSIYTLVTFALFVPIWGLAWASHKWLELSSVATGQNLWARWQRKAFNGPLGGLQVPKSAARD